MRIGCSEEVSGVRYYSLDINAEYRERMMQELAVAALEQPDDLITEDEIELIIGDADTRFNKIKYSNYFSWQDAIKEHLLYDLRRDENDDGSEFTTENIEMYEILGRIDCE